MIVTCTRPSTLSGALDDKGGLIPYAAATAFKTVATNPDLLTRLALLGQTDETHHWKAYKPLYDEADKRGGWARGERGDQHPLSCPGPRDGCRHLLHP
jgi:hypothetical protein